MEINSLHEISSLVDFDYTQTEVNALATLWKKCCFYSMNLMLFWFSEINVTFPIIKARK